MKQAAFLPAARRDGRRLHGLPHLAAIGRGPDHAVTGLAAECLAESGQVRKRAVDAELGNRVRIALDHLALRFGASFIAAPLAPGQEELLVGREAVDGRLGPLPSRDFW